MRRSSYGILRIFPTLKRGRVVTIVLRLLKCFNSFGADCRNDSQIYYHPTKWTHLSQRTSSYLPRNIRRSPSRGIWIPQLSQFSNQRSSILQIWTWPLLITFSYMFLQNRGSANNISWGFCSFPRRMGSRPVLWTLWRLQASWVRHFPQWVCIWWMVWRTSSRRPWIHVVEEWLTVPEAHNKPNCSSAPCRTCPNPPRNGRKVNENLFTGEQSKQQQPRTQTAGPRAKWKSCIAKNDDTKSGCANMASGLFISWFRPPPPPPQ